MPRPPEQLGLGAEVRVRWPGCESRRTWPGIALAAPRMPPFSRVAVAATALMAGAIIASIAVSAWRTVEYSRVSPVYFSIALTRGRIEVTTFSVKLSKTIAAGARTQARWEWARHGCALDWGVKFDFDGPVRVNAVPLWCPLALLAIPAMVLWRKRVRDNRSREQSLCAACGYSLAGLMPHAARCPECGLGPGPAGPRN